MTRQGVTVAQDDNLHAGSGDGHIHAAQVTEETNLPFVVRPYHRYDDDVAFLSLKTINRIDTDESAEGFEVGAFHQQTPQILHLSTVGRDNAHIDTFVQQSLFANTLEILLEDMHGQQALSLVDTTIALAYEFFLEGKLFAF